MIDTAASKSADSAPLPADTTSKTDAPKSAGVLAAVTDKIKSVLPSATSKSEPIKTGLKEGSSESTYPPRADGVIEIGSLGILHPSVLASFEIPYPCSALEFDLAPFVKEERPVWA